LVIVGSFETSLFVLLLLQRKSRTGSERRNLIDLEMLFASISLLVLCSVLSSVDADAFVHQYATMLRERRLPLSPALTEKRVGLERNPFTGNIQCGTNPIYEYHQYLQTKISAGAAKATTPCYETSCDDPNVRDSTPKHTRSLRIAFTVWNKQVFVVFIVFAVVRILFLFFSKLTKYIMVFLNNIYHFSIVITT
jgi:hypothetical protein